MVRTGIKAVLDAIRNPKRMSTNELLVKLIVVMFNLLESEPFRQYRVRAPVAHQSARNLVPNITTDLQRQFKPESNAVIHYSDKTKVMARMNTSFSENTPETMRALLTRHGYTIFEEDLTSMWHSSLVRFTV